MADVSISLDLQAKQLYDDLQRVQTNFAGFASQVTAHGDKAGKNFASGFSTRVGEVRSALTGTLGALGIGVGIGAVVSEFNKVIAKGSEIHDLAAKFQITAEQLQLIGNAAALDDIPLEKVGVALNKLAIGGATATKEGSKVNTILKDLKINADTYATANPAEKFLQLSDAYVASGKSGQAYADIAQLIGVRNTALLLTAQQGRKGIEDISNTMGIMSTSVSNDLDKAGDSIKKFENAFTIMVGNIISKGPIQSDAVHESAASVHDFLVGLREAVGLQGLAEKLGVAGAPKREKPKEAIAAAVGANIEPIEGTGYGSETRDVYRGGAAETPEESVKRVEEEAAVSERRRHLLNLKSALEEKGLTLGTASSADIAGEENRLWRKEQFEKQAEFVEKQRTDQATATEELYHPGKKLEEELGGLEADESTDQLVEQTDLLKEIRDNTAEMGANQ